jgi:hypothetical protein
MQYLTVDEFEDIYKKVLDELSNYKIVCCSTVYLDSKIYSNATMVNYEEANKFLNEIEKQYENVIGYCDLYNLQKHIVQDSGSFGNIYCNDNFHPNERGYRFIANKIGGIIENEYSKEN